MEIDYYLGYIDKPVLIINLSILYIIVSNFSPWIARNVEEYDYINAEWRLINKKYKNEIGAKSLKDNNMFLSTIERNQPFFNRKIISVLFKKY